MPSISRRLPGFTITTALAVAAGPGLAQTPSQQDALKAATQRFNAIKGATGIKPTAQRLPPGDPCTMATLATVQKLLPAVKVAERSTRLEADFGILECQWKDGSGSVLLLGQDTYSRGSSAKDDAMGNAEMFTGMNGASKNFRIETFPGVGADNAAYAEAADRARGIPSGHAYVGVRKGEREIHVAAPAFSTNDRAQTLKGLEALGKEMASRL